MSTLIEQVRGLEILDSRGNPTGEVEIELASGSVGRAAVPSGASTGIHEAVELRDQDPQRVGGKGVSQAVAHVDTEIRATLRGHDVLDQEALDRLLLQLDGTPNKASLGANAILGASLAAARAGAAATRLPLYRYLGGVSATTLPVPFFNILNGGVHANWQGTDFQEFMIAPVGAPSFREALRWGSETYQSLKAVLKAKGYSTCVGDEGGLWRRPSRPTARPSNSSSSHRAGRLPAGRTDRHRPGSRPLAAFTKTGCTSPHGGAQDSRRRSWWPCMPTGWQNTRSSPSKTAWPRMIGRVGGAQQAWWPRRTHRRRYHCHQRVTPGPRHRRGSGQCLLHQAQSDRHPERDRAAIEMARKAGWGAMVSHRSGETVDSFISDFTVAMGTGPYKTGAPCRGERVEKYNQLLRIERDLGASARYAGRAALVR